MDFNSNGSKEVDWMAFERQYRETLYELQRKRILLEECRQELNETILKQQDLERQLAYEKRNHENDNLQNSLLAKATKTLEEDRQEMKMDIIKYRVQSDIATAERDAMKEQTRALLIENRKLKQQVEDLEGKHRCHLAFQKDVGNQETKIKNAISQLNSAMETVRKQQEGMQNIRQNNETCVQLQQVAKQCQTQRDNVIKQKDEIEYKLVSKTAELEKLKELLTNSSLIQQQNGQELIIEYWRETAKNLRSQLNAELDGNVLLTNTLKLTNETKTKLEERDLELMKKNKELEEQISQLTIKVASVRAESQRKDEKEIAVEAVKE